MSEIHVLKHHAMATYFEVRIADEEYGYAEQAARTTFNLVDQLEGLLSRFRDDSEISQIARLARGETFRLSEPTFACLELARRMEIATRGAFSVTAAAKRSQSCSPRWCLERENFAIRCEWGRLEFDLGGIGKGFALDRMAEEIALWGCRSFLLVAGGSSVLAGASPCGTAGWKTGFGQRQAEPQLLLQDRSLSGSGLAVKGHHIINPYTGEPALRRPCAWAMASTAAESDALSTACMVLDENEIAECAAHWTDWLVFLNDTGCWRMYGNTQLAGVKTHDA